MDYNTGRNYLGMKEYGRHVQRMVEYLLTIEDRAKRQQQAQGVIELMGFLNPHLKNVEDFKHKLWDHLFFISDFKLDVDSPYPIPQKETYKLKPDPLPYPKRHPKYAHLGKNLEVPTLEGFSKITVEPGSQPNTIIKLKGKGLQGRGFRGRGDQYVRLVVNIPKKLSKHQKDLLKDLEDSFD